MMANYAIAQGSELLNIDPLAKPDQFYVIDIDEKKIVDGPFTTLDAAYAAIKALKLQAQAQQQVQPDPQSQSRLRKGPGR